MNITKDTVGKKVKRPESADQFRITALGNYSFLARKVHFNYESTEYLYDNDGTWELVKEKKLLAPCLVQPRIKGPWGLSQRIFENKQEAEQYEPTANNVIWPAPLPNKDGYYEIPD